MIAAPSAIVFLPGDDNSHLDMPRLSTHGQSLLTCGVLPQPVAGGRMSTPIELSSTANSTINPQPHGAIPDQSTTIGIGQDSRPVLPPQHPLLQSLLKVSFALFNAI